MKCPECGSEASKVGKRNHRQRWKCKSGECHSKTFTTRLCLRCDHPLAPANEIGICSSSPECRRARKRLHDRKYDKKRRRPKSAKTPKPPPVDRDHPWQIPDDGIVDQTAIDIAVQGLRKVRMTPPEQRLATERMLRLDFGVKDLCDHLGVGNKRLAALLDEMGYEVIVDPAQEQAKYSQRKLITRKDRPRGPKLLEQPLDNHQRDIKPTRSSRGR